MMNDADIIREHWGSAEDFYLERDHRTKLEVASLHDYVYTPIEIHVEPTFAEDVTIQRMVLLAANLTARWARKVKVIVPDVKLVEPLRIHGDQSLSERIKREMLEADPFGNFEVGPLKSSDDKSIRLRVGHAANTTFPIGDTDYCIDAVSWTVIGRRGKSKCPLECRNATAPTAALAAAIGAADLFKRAIGHSEKHWIGELDWCTWDHICGHDALLQVDIPTAPEKINVGNVLLAGVGAVGSAFLYVLSLMEVRGHVTLLDRDCVETSNLNRAPLFTALDACLSRKKTDVGLLLLRSLNCRATAVNGTWHEHGKALSREPFDVWISLTNEDGAWAEVPFQLPPVVLHGTTTSGWGIGVGRHIPRLEDCTACRLPLPHAEFRGPCSQGEVSASTERQSTRASLPFLSAASAALIATELLKLEYSNASALPNSVCADFRQGLPVVVAQTFGPTVGCRGCRMAELELWTGRGGRGRYSELSNGQVRAA